MSKQAPSMLICANKSQGGCKKALNHVKFNLSPKQARERNTRCILAIDHWIKRR